VSTAADDLALEFAERAPESTRSRLLTWQDPLPTAAVGAEMAGIGLHARVRGRRARAAADRRDDARPPGRDRRGPGDIRGEPGEEHYNPIGVVHGGWVSTLLDSALGCAVHTTLPAGVGYTTLTLETKFVRPISRETGVVRCEAEVLHRGRQQAAAEARAVDSGGKLLAHGTATCIIFGG
jgi:uncharacterized protein (TIGR00369 family)